MGKFIITESERMSIRGLYLMENDNASLFFRRRMDILLNIIDDEEFYYDTDFCDETFEEFLEYLLLDIKESFNELYPSFISFEYIEKVFGGKERFLELLMELRGEKILNLYNEKTKDCVDE